MTTETQTLPLLDQLKGMFGHYTTANLVDVAADDFEMELRKRLGGIDAEGEGYQANEVEQQRDLSVKFHWGHNHDFGSFALTGRMGDRHLQLFTDFVDFFEFTPDSLHGKNVLDVGCWTGGTTLLLAAMAERVLAIEEVNKYAQTVAYLANAFGLSDRVEARSLSIYQCNTPEFEDQFDVVYFPGVIYHLSDPVLALRILFNALKPGGEILLESAGIDHNEPMCQFEGNSIVRSGTREDLNRGGWNWFLPSASALERMLHEAGFDQIDTRWSDTRNRVFGYAKKVKQVGICKAGLSVKEIR